MRFYVFTLACLMLFPAFIAETAFASDSGLRSTLETIDKDANPCVDFYQYSCGSWLKTAVIPADQPRWGSFSELQERNRAILREILEKAAVANNGRNHI